MPHSHLYANVSGRCIQSMGLSEKVTNWGSVCLALQWIQTMASFLNQSSIYLCNFSMILIFSAMNSFIFKWINHRMFDSSMHCPLVNSLVHQSVAYCWTEAYDNDTLLILQSWSSLHIWHNDGASRTFYINCRVNCRFCPLVNEHKSLEQFITMQGTYTYTQVA